MRIAFLYNEAKIPKIAGSININKIIRIVPLPACVLVYGFQNNNIAQRMMHPTDAMTPAFDHFDFKVIHLSLTIPSIR
jgi:hypothetical protein